MKLLFTRNKSPVSRLIRRITWFQYSHAAITDGEMVWEATHARGVHMIPKAQWDAEHEKDEPFELPIAVDKIKVVKRLNARLGAGYDWFGLVAFIFNVSWGRNTGELNRYTCGEYIAHAINYDRVFFADENHYRRVPRHVFLAGYSHAKAEGLI